MSNNLLGVFGFADPNKDMTPLIVIFKDENSEIKAEMRYAGNVNFMNSNIIFCIKMENLDEYNKLQKHS